MKDTRLKTDKTITVKGVTVGNLKAGDVIDRNTPITEVIERLLVKYNAPTASLSAGAATVEAGTNLNRSITGSFTRNDGGELTGYWLRRNSVQVLDVAQLQTYTEATQIGDETYSYEADFTYASSGSVSAGTLTASASIAGRRQVFYGTSCTAASSDQIRALAGKTLNPVNGTTFTLNIPQGATNVVFAYPATLRDVLSVKYVEGMNAEVKDIFTQATLQVAGANSYSPISYKVYVYTPAQAFQNNISYLVTI